MIDIHCHILPNIDDGAKTIEDSLEMAKIAVADGITTIIATPHHQNGRFINVKSSIIERVKELNEELTKQSIPLTILPGQEPRIYGELVEDYEKGEVLTLNDGKKYVMVEFSSSQVPKYAEQLLFDIQLQGLNPVIVHPERNAQIMEQPDLLYDFVKKGALTQVTASSVTGHFGKKIQKFSQQLIEANLTHFIASDAHNTSGRTFRLSEAYNIIEKQYGTNMVYFFTENAEYLVKGQMVDRGEPHKVKRKKFLGIF
ncbi:tyrosine-protein phosphatase [Bacillus songklensis]|uniref:Tyrosine-protein phosphatase n=1 Tax=Bacillus songklensis TaxID=1069116 RepID=A0ABV8B2Y8_9BACI